jgi:cold shock CspA family protein
MRLKGTLVEWKDDRGFGFIEPAEGGARVFCHIKAFDVRVRRPTAGDRITYQVTKDKDGRLRADHVRPVGLEEASYQSNNKSRRSPRARRSSPRRMGVAILLVAVASYAGWDYLKGNHAAVMPSVFKLQSEPVENLQSPAFQCDGRTHCSQMHSRAEAEFFIKHCPNTKMDGDNDGEPCENDSRF